jgi:hypothetical protein
MLAIVCLQSWWCLVPEAREEIISSGRCVFALPRAEGGEVTKKILSAAVTLRVVRKYRRAEYLVGLDDHGAALGQSLHSDCLKYLVVEEL